MPETLCRVRGWTLILCAGRTRTSQAWPGWEPGLARMKVTNSDTCNDQAKKVNEPSGLVGDSKECGD